ncbi:zinc finger E-box-binding homeobox 2-like [Anoplophora glabripennis]|uniref:zinc finger E-box-binding homeobox 2-like n=1 Tax=Anoplophora glabripennis TaxID=217634 RepID=UPI000874964D|nr:zinc finger E-box-binding homeobox 2-like [Anoplophora glabripennis]
MTGVQETSCRLCHTTVTITNFSVIDNVIRNVLDALLLKLKFDSESKEVICNTCRKKLYAAFEFKSTCLNTNNTIVPQVDLKQVYMKEESSKSMDISDSQKICRLCMQPVRSEFTFIHEEELETIQKFAPEMNIDIKDHPIVCKECFDSLCIHNSFLRECLEVEEKIKGSFDSQATERQIDTLPCDLFVKTENLYKEFDINRTDLSIKTECVDIKSEDEERSDMPLQRSDNEPFQESDCKDTEEEGCQHGTGSENKSNTTTKQVQMYKCNDCDYETKHSGCLKTHQLKHKDPSQVQMYRCNQCDYETKYRENIKHHQLTHKDPSETEMYRCNHCEYETKYRENIKQHQLTHKDPSEVQMYKCNDCDYKTKYKHVIKKHQSTKHKDPSQM